VVLEHRNLANEMPFSNNLDLNSPDAVVTYLVNFFKMNKKRPGLWPLHDRHDGLTMPGCSAP
jgi:hypothetical protein